MGAESFGDFVDHALHGREGCYVTVGSHNANAEGSVASGSWWWKSGVDAGLLLPGLWDHVRIEEPRLVVAYEPQQHLAVSDAVGDRSCGGFDGDLAAASGKCTLLVRIWYATVRGLNTV